MIYKSKLMLIGTVAALLAGGTSLAMAQNGDLAASSISGDLVVVRTPNGAAAYVPYAAAHVSANRSHHKGKTSN
jgi:hypothetical protein